MNNPYQKVIDKYKAVDLQTRVEAASPHELISLLFQGAISHITRAIECMKRNQIKEKGEHLSRAIGILDGLKGSLNMKEGGDVSKNLLAFYNQIQNLLLKGNIQNSEQILIKSKELLDEVHGAWLAIKPD
jgi:flagellar protein FliS